MILLALLPAFERQGDLVGLEEGLESRIVVVPQCRYVDQYLAATGILIGADERESRIAAHHLAVIYIEDAAARTMHRIHINFVKSLQHLKPPRYRGIQRDPRIPKDSQVVSPTLFALSQDHGSRSPAP